MNNWTSLEHNAYTPYSKKPAACIVESNSGKFFAGVRIENVSYPLSIPAVQAACCICLSEGETPAKAYLEKAKQEQLSYWKEEFGLEIIETTELSEITPESLIQKSKDIDIDAPSLLAGLLDNAVTPNSQFPVSALLFVEEGFFTGVNVEVSDWTKGLCAERVAICKAVAEGYSSFGSMEIHTRFGEVSSPCGACRQVIQEHLPYNKLKLHHADGTLSEHLTVDLLPFSFKSSALKK